MMRSSVDLPAPFAPMRAVVAASVTRKARSASSGRPSGSEKETPLTSMKPMGVIRSVRGIAPRRPTGSRPDYRPRHAVPPRTVLRQAGGMQRIAAEPLDALRTRTSAKWRTYPADVLPLPVAEMDYPLAEPVAAALHAAIHRSDTGYISGSLPVAEAFQGFASTRLGWEVDPARVTCTADVSMGIVEVLRRVTSPGDGVIITPPIYPPFFDLVTEASCAVVEVPIARRHR